MATAKISEVKELGKPGSPVEINNYVNHYDEGEPYPALGVCFTLG